MIKGNVLETWDKHEHQVPKNSETSGFARSTNLFDISFLIIYLKRFPFTLHRSNRAMFFCILHGIKCIMHGVKGLRSLELSLI